MKCLITEKVNEKGIELLRKHFTVDLAYDKNLDEIKNMVGEYDVLLVRAETPVDKEMIDLGKNLKIVGMAGIGLNHIDVEYAKSKDIKVINVPNGSITSVAELAMTLILGSCRKLYNAVHATKNGKWDKTGFTGNLLDGKTVGILSLGKIGFRVAELCQAFNMNVVAYDPYLNPEVAKKINVELLPLEDVFKKADIISIHTPLTKETHHMVSEKELNLMKDGSFLFNLGRGGIVDEKALYKALTSGKLKAAAADVMENEPPKEEDQALLKLDNFMATCHIGAGTEEAQEFISVSLADQIFEYFNLK
ncbi:D-2-hydroxyacid dehydrogenase [Anaerophilus nitritogenes]|uniref:D-2-hydroxyacid dehydrogenase n=1 Tax=Anaerophilus nitritogenes TaxID=2498136 RepID=UPI00101C0774|nr:D-2-hydroxyacid dehydrogenase [Anaerophilus nitritogenes]